jgi:P-type E1-E2 ATPase
MIKIEIPGSCTLALQHAVFDYNGTIALDGKLDKTVADRLCELQKQLTIHVLTADTNQTVEEACKGYGFHVSVFSSGAAAAEKRRIVESLGKGVVCFGNGFNDIGMAEAADLAIAVLAEEGACAKLLTVCDLVVGSPLLAIDLLLKPHRLIATLRA